MELGLKGNLALMLFDAQTKEEAMKQRRAGRWVERVDGDNLMVTVGLSLLASGLNWTAVQGQNPSWGSPFSAVDYGALWGAVGTSSTAAAAADVKLGTELARQTLDVAAVSGNLIVWDFFFPTSSGNGVLTEVGVFFQATGTVNSGTMMDHLILGSSVTKTAANSMLLEATLTLTSG